MLDIRRKRKECKRLSRLFVKNLKNEMCPVEWLKNVTGKDKVYFTRGEEKKNNRI